MNSSWKLIPKIISGEKTIESRWYRTRRAPWNSIKKNDRIFFKNSGNAVIAEAIVSRVLQFTFNNVRDVRTVIKKYGKQICLINSRPETWTVLPRYGIIIFLKNPKHIPEPFYIDKTGFGSATAWISVKNIETIKIRCFIR